MLFPDGKLNVCTECVKRDINFDDLNQVINFLRQIDRPFYLEQWEKAKAKGTANPLSAYLSVVGVLKQYSDKKFDDSDGITNSNQMISSVDSMTTEDDDGEKIVITNSKVAASLTPAIFNAVKIKYAIIAITFTGICGKKM